MGRTSTPEGIAHAVAFFASEGAGFVCGQVLYVVGVPRRADLAAPRHERRAGDRPVTVEIEGSARPACVAESLALLVP